MLSEIFAGKDNIFYEILCTKKMKYDNINMVSFKMIGMGEWIGGLWKKKFTEE